MKKNVPLQKAPKRNRRRSLLGRKLFNLCRDFVEYNFLKIDLVAGFINVDPCHVTVNILIKHDTF